MDEKNPLISAPMEGTFFHAVPGAVDIGDYVIRLTEEAHTWGPGGFHKGWEVAENAKGSGDVYRYTYVDGSYTYVNPNTNVLIFRPEKG